MARALRARSRSLAATALLAVPLPQHAPPRDLAPTIAAIRATHDVPALAGAVVLHGDLVAIGVDGLRCSDRTTPVTAADAFHLGSCGKAMTATAIARLVDRGALSWDRTLAELFPERANAIAPGFRTVTVRQLLDHRAGLPRDESGGSVLDVLLGGDRPATEQRLRILERATARAPTPPPPGGHVYSNTGYVIAGAILERVTGESWEQARRELVFEPLGMTSAGFGPPGTAGRPGAPWGHAPTDTGCRPIDPGDVWQRRPAWYGPAGDVHASLTDWARFVAVHAHGEPTFLRPGTRAAMHAPEAGADYACGFAVTTMPWASGPVLAHHGSSAGWQASTWISPHDDLAVLVACNEGGERAQRACETAAAALVDLYAPRRQQPAAHTVRASVPLHDGRVDLAELGTALLDAWGLDASAIDVPHHLLKVSGVRGWLTLVAARHALLDTVRFRCTGDALQVTVDLDRVEQVGRELQTRLVAFVGARLHEDLLQRHYALALPAGLDPERPLAVLVHGVESSPHVWDDLRAFLSRGPRPFQVATFAYPDDEAVDRIAAALAERLKALGAQPVVLVGHSMGGLIARDVVEDPALDPGNVHTLITIGAPNQGSSLAELRIVLEAAHLITRRDPHLGGLAALLAGMRANLIDGLGEAGGDLAPRSALIAELAARPRNPHVTYHVVLGSQALLSKSELALLRRLLLRSLPSTPWGILLRPAWQRWLDGLDELESGRGDGAVELTRGALPGVTPVVVARDHLGLIRLRGIVSPRVAPDEHPVFLLVARWLREAK